MTNQGDAQASPSLLHQTFPRARMRVSHPFASFAKVGVKGQSFTSFSIASSSITLTFSSRALSSFEPASSPATT